MGQVPLVLITVLLLTFPLLVGLIGNNKKIKQREKEQKN